MHRTSGYENGGKDSSRLRSDSASIFSWKSNGNKLAFSRRGGESVYVYDGVFMDEDLYEGRLEEIRQKATAVEIELFMQQHDLLMIVEK